MSSANRTYARTTTGCCASSPSTRRCPATTCSWRYSNRCTSKVRAVFQSGVFAEGWAVYVTQVMMDVGYGADDPALMLVHLKFYLRSVINAMIDIGIHAGEMDEQEAMRLMVEGRLPGAVGSGQQVEPRPAVEHPVVRVLPGSRRNDRS